MNPHDPIETPRAYDAWEDEHRAANVGEPVTFAVDLSATGNHGFAYAYGYTPGYRRTGVTDRQKRIARDRADVADPS